MIATDALALLAADPEHIDPHQYIISPNGMRRMSISFTIPDEDYHRLQARAPDTARIIRALDQLDPDELPAVLWEIQNGFAVT